MNINEQEQIELKRGKLQLKPQSVVKTGKLKDKLHIVYIMVWTEVCGGSKIILEYANRLSKSGDKITIVTYDKKPQWYDLDEKIEFIQVPENKTIEESIPKCDVVVVTSWKNIYDAVKANVAPVTFFEQGGSHLFDFEKLSNEKKDAVMQRYSLVPFVYTVSSCSKDMIKSIYNKDSHVICNALDTSIFYPRQEFDENKQDIDITIIGSEDFKFKNIQGILEAVRELRKIHSNINLNWITQTKPIKNPEPAIVNPPQKEIGNILRKTDIYICNSEYESFGLPTLEAMTCGAAVITTDTGGMRDFVVDGKNALVINQHDVKDMISKVEMLIKDKEFRIKIAIEGIKTASTYNWEESTKQCKAYFQEIATYECIKEL